MVQRACNDFYRDGSWAFYWSGSLFKMPYFFHSLLHLQWNEEKSHHRRNSPDEAHEFQWQMIIWWWSSVCAKSRLFVPRRWWLPIKLDFIFALNCFWLARWPVCSGDRPNARADVFEGNCIMLLAFILWNSFFWSFTLQLICFSEFGFDN